MSDCIVRPIRPDEIDKIAELISRGYYDDIFFHWCVPDDKDRHKIVTDYYKVYLSAKGTVTHVAETPGGDIAGAAMWLPHDVDAGIYDEINKTTGVYASKFQAVADASHYSEPPMAPFYQLVGFVTAKEMRGRGIGSALLKSTLDKFDKLGIPTYLEASTPYYGKGVYGKFGYRQVGELMVFAETAVLYPLWRPARKAVKASFGGRVWHVLEERNDAALLLSEKIIEPGKYHDVFEKITWADSVIRKYLNGSFYEKFAPHDKPQILETTVITSENPWSCVNGGEPAADKIFLLSIEEVLRYFGDIGQLKNPAGNYFIDDGFNSIRKATLADGAPTRWFLRTPGNSQDFVATVTADGRISVSGDFVNRSSSALFNVGIRPAMWVKKERIAFL